MVSGRIFLLKVLMKIAIRKEHNASLLYLLKCNRIFVYNFHYVVNANGSARDVSVVATQ